MAEHQEEQGDEWTPPTPQRVHARALVLSAVVARGFLEQDAANREAEALRLRIRSWLTFVGAATEAEPQEHALLQAPLGTLLPQQAGEASWRSEGLAMLAWALGLSELPGYDEFVDPKAVADAVGYLRDEAKASLASATLRPAEEINQCAAQMFALHWRLRNFGLKPEAMDFQQFARDAWFGPLDVTRLRFIDGDLAIGDLSISEADEEDFQMCIETTMERHQAANWLAGQQDLYSEVTTDT
jgi:hypothetical protein